MDDAAASPDDDDDDTHRSGEIVAMAVTCRLSCFSVVTGLFCFWLVELMSFSAMESSSSLPPPSCALVVPK